MNKLENPIVRNLLEIGAIKFNFEEPFTWTSGIKSPVYCDNRISLSYTELRSLVKDAYVKTIQDNFPDVEVIAAVATGAIAQGALVADKMNLPLVYIRDKAKEFGLRKSIEGTIRKGQKAVILEDLVSTGKSSLMALDELRNAEADVLGMVATISYELPVAKKRFMDKNCILFTLSKFSILVEEALNIGYITKYEADNLDKWHKSIA